MARLGKGTEERRGELLRAARKLFVRNGFADVSVGQIVRDIGVAQGTFYYYFDSKEAVLDALIADYVRDVGARLMEVARDRTLDPRRALERMVRIELESDQPCVRELGGIRGSDAHSKLFSAMFRTLVPIYQGVVARGQKEKAFHLGDPDLLAEIVVLTTHSLFDRDLLGWTAQEYSRRRRALAPLICKVLGLPDGELDFGEALRAHRTR